MKGRLRVPRVFSVDSGVFLAYFLGENLGASLRSSGIIPPGKKTMMYCSRTMVSELFYILCQRRGQDFAQQIVESLLASDFVTVLASDQIDIVTGHYKCSRALSLADCYVLAVAKVQHIPAVFARKEEDFKKELGRLSFDLRLIFLEDQIKGKDSVIKPIPSGDLIQKSRARARKYGADIKKEGWIEGESQSR